MNPILFELPTPWGSKPFYSFGVMLGLAIIVGWILTSHAARRYAPEWSLDKLFNICVLTAIGGVISARLFYIGTHLDRFHSWREFFSLSQGGMVSYGALLGGALCAYISCRIAGFSLLRFGDIFTPALAFGLGIGRIGCYLYGCDFGKPLSKHAPTFLVKLGTFPRWSNLSGSPAWKHHTETYGLSILAHHSLAVHPTQLYDAAIMLGWLPFTFLILRRQHIVGANMLAITLVYTGWRFIVEFLRDDPQRTMVANHTIALSLAQVLSSVCFVGAVIALIILRRPQINTFS